MVLQKAYYSSACVTEHPMQYGWTVWSEGVSPPPLLSVSVSVSASASASAPAATQPLPLTPTCPSQAIYPPPGDPDGCSKLQWHTYTLEWREKWARVWFDGKLVNEWSAERWADHCTATNSSAAWRAKSIEFIQQPLFLALTACVMDNVPPLSMGNPAGADGSPTYFVADWVRVCK